MDFGSKYAFNGNAQSVYYSCVPIEDGKKVPVYDSVYESINVRNCQPLSPSTSTSKSFVESKQKDFTDIQRSVKSATSYQDSCNDLPPPIPKRKFEISDSESDKQIKSILNSEEKLYPQLSHLKVHADPLPNLYEGRPIIKPTASSTTESMKKEKFIETKNIPTNILSQPAYNPYAFADTNVVAIKMDMLENNKVVCENYNGYYCASCHALVKNKNETCSFCGYADVTSFSTKPTKIEKNDKTIIIRRNLGNSQTFQPLIVFCVDTSGSMCVTSQIHSNGTNFYMSRLQGVQQAIIQQIEYLYQKDPNTQVALVAFSDGVILYGDGSPYQVKYLNDMELYDTDYILTTGQSSQLPSALNVVKQQLINTVNLLKESGGTALGPAMLLSIALASQRRGSQVVLCTDGRANIGVGSLESQSEYEICHHFYNEATDIAINNGVSVSILSISGSDSRLVQLGNIADKTAGQVMVANVDNLTKEFGVIVSEPLLATDVSVSIIAGNHIEERCKSCIKKDVGNVTKQTVMTFKYEINKSDPHLPQELPFQLQVDYLTLNGDKCKRVITDLQPVTENMTLVEKNMNPFVLGTHATQMAANLTLEGDLDNAALTAEAHKVLIKRGIAHGEQCNSFKNIYGEVTKNIDAIEQDISTMKTDLESQYAPPLPPRIPIKHGASVSAVNMRLPDIPTQPVSATKKVKGKKKIANIGDDIASKFYKYKKACASKLPSMSS